MLLLLLTCSLFLVTQCWHTTIDDRWQSGGPRRRAQEADRIIKARQSVPLVNVSSVDANNAYDLQLDLFPARQLPKSDVFKIVISAMTYLGQFYDATGLIIIFPLLHGLQLEVRSTFEFKLQLFELTYLLEALVARMAERSFAECYGTLLHAREIVIARFELKRVGQLLPNGSDDERNSTLINETTKPLMIERAVSPANGGDLNLTDIDKDFNVEFVVTRFISITESLLMLSVIGALKSAVDNTVEIWHHFEVPNRNTRVKIWLFRNGRSGILIRKEAILALALAARKQYDTWGQYRQYAELHVDIRHKRSIVATGALTWQRVEGPGYL